MKKTQFIAALVLSLVMLSTTAFAGAIQIASTSYTPIPAAPGQLVTVYVSIYNNSQAPAENVVIEPRPTYPFTLSEAGRSRIEVPRIGGFETFSGRFEIQVDKQALNGTYGLEIIAREGTQAGISQTLQVQVLTFKPQIEIVSADIAMATAGQVIPVELGIRNIGSSNAINILMGTVEDRTVTSTGEVIDRPIKTIGPSFEFVPSLNANDTTTVFMQLGIDPNTPSGTHLVPFRIQYQDENRSDFEITRYIGIHVGSQAELDGYFSYDDLARPFSGTTTDITVNLFNRGPASAKNVVVEIPQTPHLDILSEQTVFIGTLDSDDFDSFDIHARVTAQSPGNFEIPIRFVYKNEDNTSYTVERTLTLQVFDATAAAGANQGGSILDAWPIVLILAIIGYFAWRRWFRNKKR